MYPLTPSMVPYSTMNFPEFMDQPLKPNAIHYKALEKNKLRDQTKFI
jgi:hypothetical protein